MKHQLTLYGFCLLMVFLTACPDETETPGPTTDPDPEPTLAEVECEKLNGKTWKPGTAIKSSVDITAEMEGFTIKFDCNPINDGENVGGTFTTTNGKDVFPSTGKWSFDTNTLGGSNKVMILTIDGEGRRVSYSLNSDGTTLTLNFEISSDKKSGDFTFELVQ